MLNIQFDIQQMPWNRPNYSSIPDKLLIPSLKADFEDVVLNEFKAEVYRNCLSNRFPLNESIAILIEICSSNDLNILLASKTVIDALNNHAFTDDVRIKNLYITKNTSTEDRIRISLLNSLNVTASTNLDELKTKALITFTVKAKPIDRIISIPMDSTIRILNNSQNLHYVNKLKSIIHSNINNPISLSNIGLDFNIYTKAVEADLDNLCLNYLLAIKGILIKDFSQIKTICANLKYSLKDKSTLTIYEL